MAEEEQTKCKTYMVDDDEGQRSSAVATTANLLKEILDGPMPNYPPARQKFGSSIVHWWSPLPGKAVIMAFGGSLDDRTFAEQKVKIQLAGYGIQRIAFTVDGSSEKTAGWTDIINKAKRLIQSGQVMVLRNGYNDIAGHVIGDHGEYDVQIGRDDPFSRSITTWQCECPWDQYAWQRTRKWKRLEGRPCSHVMALYWKALATPLDEDYDPSSHGPMGTGQVPPGPSDGGNVQPVMPQPEHPSMPGPPPEPSPFGGDAMPQTPHVPDAGLGPPGPGAQAPLALPASPGILPPSPMEQLQMMQPPMPGATPGGMPAPPGSVSVPGAKMPSPFNPMQYPGGTYSKVAADFTAPEIVRLKNPVWGMAEGKSEAHGAGQYQEVPVGSTGEVLGQDETTGWVEVIFPLEGGEMTPYHVRCFVEPGDIEKTRLRPPGPFIKRRH